MNRLRAEEIKNELRNCDGDGGLSIETINDMIKLMERMYPNNTNYYPKDTSPMIGTNPFIIHKMKIYDNPSKDFNESLNYRISKK